MFGLNLGNLIFRIGADTSGVGEAERDVKRNMNSMNAGAVALGTTIGNLASQFIVAGARMVRSMTTAAFETIDAQAKLARAVGGTTAALQSLERAGDRAGVAKNELGSAATRLNQRLGQVIATGKGLEQTFDILGVTAQQLADMDIDERFAFISDRMREAGLSTQEMSFHLRELGIRQSSVITLLQGGGDEIRRSREAIEAFGVAVSEVDAATIERANDAMADLERIWEGVANQIATRLGPLVEHLADWLGEAAREGDGFGSAIDQAISLGIRLFSGLQREVYLFRVGLDEAIAGVLNLFDTFAGAPPALLGWLTGTSSSDWGFEPINQEFGKLRETLEEPPSDEEWQKWFESIRDQARETSEATLAERAKLRESLWDDDSGERFGGGSSGRERGGGGGRRSAAEREQERLEQQLEALRDALATAEEAELASYEKRLEQLEDFRERQMIAEEEYQDLRERAHADHTERMAEISRRAAAQEARVQQQLYGAVTSTLQSITKMMDSEGDKQIGIQKAIGVAIALINTYQGITEALKLPFPLNWAQAAAVAAAGFAQVMSIRSASRGGGGTPTVGGGGGAAEATAPAQQQTLYIEGINPNQLYSGESVRELAERLVEYQRDGGHVVFQQT